MLHIYRIPGSLPQKVLRKVNTLIPTIENVETEYCFNVELLSSSEGIPVIEKDKLLWLLSETFQPQLCREGSSFLIPDGGVIVEVGPRLAFRTAWSSNCASMCQGCGITAVGRIERSRRFKLIAKVKLRTV